FPVTPAPRPARLRSGCAPAQPTVQSTTTSPGFGSRAARTSSRRTGRCLPAGVLRPPRRLVGWRFIGSPRHLANDLGHITVLVLDLGGRDRECEAGQGWPAIVPAARGQGRLHLPGQLGGDCDDQHVVFDAPTTRRLRYEADRLLRPHEPAVPPVP